MSKADIPFCLTPEPFLDVCAASGVGELSRTGNHSKSCWSTTAHKYRLWQQGPYYRAFVQVRAKREPNLCDLASSLAILKSMQDSGNQRRDALSDVPQNVPPT